MTHRVTLIPGDGIGPEVVDAARGAVDATGAAIAWEPHDLGRGAFERIGEVLPQATLGSIRSNGVALKGPIETPQDAGVRNANVACSARSSIW